MIPTAFSVRHQYAGAYCRCSQSSVSIRRCCGTWAHSQYDPKSTRPCTLQALQSFARSVHTLRAVHGDVLACGAPANLMFSGSTCPHDHVVHKCCCVRPQRLLFACMGVISAEVSCRNGRHHQGIVATLSICEPYTAARLAVSMQRF